MMTDSALPDPVMPADHGGGIDAAAALFGGRRADWIDLSTGINPVPYPIPPLAPGDWAALPDSAAMRALERAARTFWQVPEGAAVLAAPGVSSLIARIPALADAGTVHIPVPTYNEHARAFCALGWNVTGGAAQAQVLVHPNNPDGRLWRAADVTAPLAVIDESFCDVVPEASLMPLAARPGTLILKSFGKFWGLAGMRLGFAIGHPVLIGRLAQMLGPWPVSGPALNVGRMALSDPAWADATRLRLEADAARLDAAVGLPVVGGTTLFRLYQATDAADWQTRLARHHIWTRTFPYNPRWLRIGLPAHAAWDRLARALKDAG
jgi:cobalamin biosynthesis protein CobC